jgi:hypothetical protein
MVTVEKLTELPWFENKKGTDSGLYFYAFRSWTCKRINLAKMRRKQRDQRRD